MDSVRIAKLIGAATAALAGMALVFHATSDLRYEWFSSTAADSTRRSAALTRSVDQSQAVGRRAYQTHCVRCHGSEGHGDGPEVANAPVPLRDLASSSWRAGAVRAAVRTVITQGTPDHKMPGLAGAISADELDSLVDHVLTLEMNVLLANAGFSSHVSEITQPLSFRDVEGNDRSLDDVRGKVVLVAFWGTTCTPCLAELPELESLAGLDEKTDFVVLPVCVDETDIRTVREVAARRAPHLPVYVTADDSVRQRFQLSHLPQAILVDRAGRTLGRSDAANGWTRNEFEKLLSACLGSAPTHQAKVTAEFPRTGPDNGENRLRQ